MRLRYDFGPALMCFAVSIGSYSNAEEAKPAPAPTAAQLSANMTARLNQHDYQGALVVAGTLEKRFPNSPEAVAAAAQIPSLQAGAAKQRGEVAQAAATTALQGQKAKDERFETCRTKLKQAQKLEVLYDLDWKPPAQPRVVAGSTFFQIPIDAKEGFAETVNCFLTAGATDKYLNFEVLDWQTGKPVGKYSYGRFSMY